MALENQTSEGKKNYRGKAEGCDVQKYKMGFVVNAVMLVRIDNLFVTDGGELKLSWRVPNMFHIILLTNSEVKVKTHPR